nr:RNA-directed DNA polymerase, eukaryota [Tanacetum cinerariifolium]
METYLSFEWVKTGRKRNNTKRAIEKYKEELEALDAAIDKDGPFILNEVLQWCKPKKKQLLIFKVYFEKAYDSVRWDFLDDVLKKFGFGNKWCAWIQSCLRSSRGSIIINGSPTEEFQSFKGHKQGDPLSPFLFILIMESLHLPFQRVVDAGMFMGIKLSHSLNLSHMFYADDVMFVGQWWDGNINTLVHVLECFYRASGLRINMSKSKIMRVHVEDEKVKYAASKLGCLILNTPFSYLGTKVVEILDGPFILNEVLQWCKPKKKQLLIFKVHFEKAYDSVRWDFLDDVLKKFGFGNKWCAWIQSCLRSSRGSIIINGSPTEEFQFFKGHKQGDPLSPFLFILIMESLHLPFQRVVDARMFMGIKLSHSLNLSHMFYADDVMFVGQWWDGNINTLVHVLECFYRASGLRINMSKSTKVGGSMSRVKEVVDK